MSSEFSRKAGIRTGYAICGEARSGSTYLSHLLKSTGTLGKPWEFFKEPGVVRQIARDPAILDAMIEAASSSNGVYGFKLFSAHFDLAAKTRWAERMPDLAFIHLRREDVLGQALSLARALQTDRFKSNENEQRQPGYDRRLIAKCLAGAVRGHARWEAWFARNAITPLRLTYESVVADPQNAADAVATHIGLTMPAPIDPGAVTLAIQRDALNDEWRARFVREAADPTYLDGGIGFGMLGQAAALVRRLRGPI